MIVITLTEPTPTKETKEQLRMKYRREPEGDPWEALFAMLKMAGIDCRMEPAYERRFARIYQP